MKFSPMFTDHAVLAAHRPIKIFGEGDGKASVSIAGITMRFLRRTDTGAPSFLLWNMADHMS